MNHFITGRLRLFAIISGLLLALNAFSLNLKIEPTISSPVSDSRYNDVIVAHNDIYYAMLDSKIQWRIKYEDWKTDENLELRYIAYSISIFNEDGKKYIEYKVYYENYDTTKRADIDAMRGAVVYWQNKLDETKERKPIRMLGHIAAVILGAGLTVVLTGSWWTGLCALIFAAWGYFVK